MRMLDSNALEGAEFVKAGFPCPDFSSAGSGKGLAGRRSGMFWQVIRLVRGAKTVRGVLLENVANLLAKKHSKDRRAQIL